MDRSEALAKIYLESLGLGVVAYEPDGQIPPDFTLGDIAIEVRRLNQNHETSNGYEGLESGQASILNFLNKLLPTFGPPSEDQGWWIFLTFRRPVDGKAVKRLLPKALADFKTAPDLNGLDTNLTRTVKLRILPAGIPVAHHFMLGGYSDLDQGGFVASEIIRNLNICIAEKVAKIAPYQNRYREWWLVLPDFIGPDLDADERQTIGVHVDLRTFSRIALIHPREPTKAFVLSRPDHN